MNRRDFVRGLHGMFVYSAVSGGRLRSIEASETPPGRDGGLHPLAVGNGVQLFLDDYLIDRMEGLRRQVQQPRRLAKPVLDNATFGTTQPYVTVLHDAKRKRFRAWYNRGSAVWHAESADGVAWNDPRVAWNLRRAFGCSLIDDGPEAPDSQRRFKLANWQMTQKRKQGRPGDEGMWVGFSPDGLRWTALESNPVLLTWPEGYGRFVRHGVQDIIDVFHDAPRGRYMAAVKVEALAEDGYARSPRSGTGFRRLVGMSSSRDFVHWEPPWRIFTPDDKDEGLLEFYGMGGMHQRGGLTIGFLRVLRDDLSCDSGGPTDGIGYTVLATSRDCQKWQRYREPFLDRNPQKGSWDHAMSWMGAALPVGDEVYLYYGGYARGHKIAPETERQIGLARLRKDRYVAVVPERDEGVLRTRPFVVHGQRLTINARAASGDVRVRLLNPDGGPLDNLGDADAKPIAGDALAAEVRWPKPLSALGERPVRLEFRLRRAALFGFEIHSAVE
jgi:hypothetical protein